MKSIILWLILNLLDTLTTILAIERGLSESNPLITWVGGDIEGLIIYKVLMTILALLFLAKIKKLHLLKWLNIGMGLVVIWNITATIIWG